MTLTTARMAEWSFWLAGGLNVAALLFGRTSEWTIACLLAACLFATCSARLFVERVTAKLEAETTRVNVSITEAQAHAEIVAIALAQMKSGRGDVGRGPAGPRPTDPETLTMTDDTTVDGTARIAEGLQQIVKQLSTDPHLGAPYGWLPHEWAYVKGIASGKLLLVCAELRRSTTHPQNSQNSQKGENP